MSLVKSRALCLLKFTRSISIRARMDQKQQAVQEVEKAFNANPYYSKYADKIKKLTVPEIEEKLKVIEEMKKEFNQTIIEDRNTTGIESSPRTYQELLKPKKRDEGKAAATVKLGGRNEVTLDDIMNVEKLNATVTSREQLEAIWMTYHKEEIAAKNTTEAENYLISGTISGEKYKQLKVNSKSNPIFLLPLPRDQGYEFFLVQFHLNEVHMTSLLAYQVHKENAPECLKLVHFDECQDKYGIVLMRGEFNKTVINQMEVTCLINQLQIFYCSEVGSVSLKIMDKFQKSPDTFDHMEIIRHIESLQM